MNNSFVEYRVKVGKELIKQGVNLLEVDVSSTRRYD